jgi:23S rRNA (uracil1939-C5)-methyltransferase/tRNA (uracil-5-)-methyltransferase
MNEQQQLQPQQLKDDGIILRNENDNENTTNSPERLWVIMVPHVVVGELCVVRIFRNQKQYSEADLVHVLEPSPDRVTPHCSLAGLCGGCQYQHMSIHAQRNWKTKHVEEVLLQQKITGYSHEDATSLHVLPTVGTEQIYHYRSKITPHYDSPRQVGGDDADDDDDDANNCYEFDAIGFQQSSNRNLVDVPECPIATEAINQKYQQVRHELQAKARDGTLMPKKNKKKKRRGSSSSGGMLGATLLFRQADDDIETGEAVVVTDHNEYMKTTVQGITFQYLAGNFFQNNNFVLPLMVNAVIEASIKPTTNGDRPSHLIDCYCGSGLFALSAASKFELCVGIEVNKNAIAEATANADMNNITNCQFMAASAEAIFTSPPTITLPGFEDQRVQDFPRDKTVVVLDPPRKGCSEEFLAQLYEYSPQRIVYMSCGPSTQARDAKGIVEVGGYDIVSTQPFDLFPQTKHIECLMIFEKKDKR